MCVTETSQVTNFFNFDVWLSSGCCSTSLDSKGGLSYRFSRDGKRGFRLSHSSKHTSPSDAADQMRKSKGRRIGRGLGLRGLSAELRQAAGDRHDRLGAHHHRQAGQGRHDTGRRGTDRRGRRGDRRGVGEGEAAQGILGRACCTQRGPATPEHTRRAG